MKSHEYLSNFIRLAKVGNGVGSEVEILQVEQRGYLFLVEFVHSFTDIVSQDEIEESLLLGIEALTDGDSCSGGALFAG